ncbi:hypothetical protein C2W62_23245 [Candidatus Entotheonella serta]|nr:hypothetical protein C2W62_23245 [Candidatus Entotheonella serta]
MNPATEQITFIQSATPALPAGEYKMKVEETFLVSLEHFCKYLPDSEGKSSLHLPDGTTHIRLLTYRHWQFSVNLQSEAFQSIMSHVNRTPSGQQTPSSLQFPFDGPPPTPSQVQMALSHQAQGALSDEDAQVLVHNAFTMGYVPLNHHLRQAGQTVSWYRGPLVPYAVGLTLTVPISGPDAANRYNPETGLFDVSYGAAWQLGQLLALQNKSFATALYRWKQRVQQHTAVAAEHKVLTEKLQGIEAFAEVFAQRQTSLETQPPPVPDEVVSWLVRLRLLYGVPFNYWVPDDRMLPPESLQFFHLDLNWLDALVDGAFSIGRATTGDLHRDAPHLHSVHRQALSAMRHVRSHRAPAAEDDTGVKAVTGFLLRSQVVAGWPGLNVKGYVDAQGETELPKLRLSHISKDILLGLFDGVINMVRFQVPPEQLHTEVEGQKSHYTTTLREFALRCSL